MGLERREKRNEHAFVYRTERKYSSKGCFRSCRACLRGSTNVKQQCTTFCFTVCTSDLALLPPLSTAVALKPNVKFTAAQFASEQKRSTDRSVVLYIIFITIL